VDCINQRKTVEFTYVDVELNTRLRNVNVYSYFSLKGFWYFSGFDLAKSDIRTFRCDRIVGELVISKKTHGYDIPNDYVTDVSFGDLGITQEAKLQIRHGRGSQLRSIASKIEVGEEFDLVELPFSSEENLASLILWHLDDVVVVQPESLKESVITSLRDLVRSHG
jgi:proteasome accessory factor B